MAVNAAAAYGLYSRDVVLTDIVRNLNQAGFENEDICMMLSPAHPIASIVRDASLFNTERETSAVTAGLIGWLSEFGAVLIPTVGFFIRSQAFFHALMVAREAPALCGNAKTLVGLGFSEEEAERFEDQIGDLVRIPRTTDRMRRLRPLEPSGRAPGMRRLSTAEISWTLH